MGLGLVTGLGEGWAKLVNYSLFTALTITRVQGSYRSSMSVKFPEFSSHGMTILLTLSKQ